MEPNLRHDPRTSAAAERERPEPKAEQTVFTNPFASEGLEQLRDSHC